MSYVKILYKFIDRLKMRGWEIIGNVNIDYKKIILIVGKVSFKICYCILVLFEI